MRFVYLRLTYLLSRSLKVGFPTLSCFLATAVVEETRLVVLLVSHSLGFAFLWYCSYCHV